MAKDRRDYPFIILALLLVFINLIFVSGRIGAGITLGIAFWGFLLWLKKYLNAKETIYVILVGAACTIIILVYSSFSLMEFNDTPFSSEAVTILVFGLLSLIRASVMGNRGKKSLSSQTNKKSSRI